MLASDTVFDKHRDGFVGRIVDDYQALEHACRGNTVEDEVR